MKPALFSVLCEIKEKTGKTLRPTVGLETPEVGVGATPSTLQLRAAAFGHRHL